MRGTYDETAKLVNDEIAKLGDTGTFAHLAEIDACAPRNWDYPEEPVLMLLVLLTTSRLWMGIRGSIKRFLDHTPDANPNAFLSV